MDGLSSFPFSFSFSVLLGSLLFEKEEGEGGGGGQSAGFYRVRFCGLGLVRVY